MVTAHGPLPVGQDLLVLRQGFLESPGGEVGIAELQRGVHGRRMKLAEYALPIAQGALVVADALCGPARLAARLRLRVLCAQPVALVGAQGRPLGSRSP